MSKILSGLEKMIYILVPVIGLVFITHSNVENFGALYLETPDGSLYLSIAENFFKNGHFIQMARPSFEGMVVPFGLPLIITIIELFCRDIKAVVCVQYIAYIMTGVYFGRTVSIVVKKVLKNYSSNLLHLVMMVAYGISACTYMFSRDVITYANPAMVLTEVWTNFFIVLFVFFFLNYDFSLGMFITALCIIVIRPAFYPFLVIAVGKMIIEWRKLSRKQRRRIIITTAVFFSVFTINTINNYIETGDVVFLENYAGIAIYQANNPSAQTDGYHSGRDLEFVSSDDTRFWDTFNDDKLTCGEKNDIYNEMASEYIRTHLKLTIKRAIIRLKYMFWDRWGRYSRIAIIGCVIAMFSYKNLFAIGISNYLIAFTTSFGLNIDRYSVFIYPFYLLSLFYLISIVMWICMQFMAGREGLSE